VIGAVDDFGRSLLRISLRHPVTAVESDMDAWVDTGFTGDLVVPRAMLSALSFPLGQSVRGTLADGSEIELDSFICLLHWFGQWQNIEVLANDGKYPLLGVGLMLGHSLCVDYCARTLTLT